jgi:hypothetical protein
MNNGTLTRTQIADVVKTLGVAGLPDLKNRPDLIPRASLLLEAA